jgi:hypothetical protein
MQILCEPISYIEPNQPEREILLANASPESYADACRRLPVYATILLDNLQDKCSYLEDRGTE